MDACVTFDILEPSLALVFIKDWHFYGKNTGIEDLHANTAWLEAKKFRCETFILSTGNRWLVEILVLLH